MATEWEVSLPTGRCAVSGRQLAEGEEFYTVLFEDGEGFRRADYGMESWPGPPPGAFCCFKSRVPIKEKRKRLLVDDDILLAFFTRLTNEGEPLRVQFRFVLALILMRKRILRYEGAITKEGVETWRMVLPRDQSVHLVIDPKLTDEQISGVSQQLSAILQGHEAASLDHELLAGTSENPDGEA